MSFLRQMRNVTAKIGLCGSKVLWDFYPPGQLVCKVSGSQAHNSETQLLLVVGCLYPEFVNNSCSPLTGEMYVKEDK